MISLLNIPVNVKLPNFLDVFFLIKQVSLIFKGDSKNYWYRAQEQNNHNRNQYVKKLLTIAVQRGQRAEVQFNCFEYKEVYWFVKEYLFVASLNTSSKLTVLVSLGTGEHQFEDCDIDQGYRAQQYICGPEV